MMPHSKTIAYSHRVELKRNATSSPDSCFDVFNESAKMHMARDNFGKAVRDADKRFIEI